jgi:hypothetical protein
VLLLFSVIAGGDVSAAETPAAAWGRSSPVPLMPPLILAAFGFLARLARRRPARARSARITWWTIAAAGLVFQAGSLRAALAERADNAAVARALESATQAGEAIVTEDAALPLVAAGLSTTRAILYVRPGGSVEGILDGLDGAGVTLLTAVSPRREAPLDPLAGREAIGRYARRDGPRRTGMYLISRFAGSGTRPTRPASPPRGD